MLETTPTEIQPPTRTANWFPLSHLSNIRWYYVLTVLTNCWFIASNWIFFWTRFMTYHQLGWLDAAAFSFGLFMEIPSGAISDLVGKKKTLVLAMFLTTVSVFGFSLSSNFTQLAFFFLVAQAGWAFYSGSAEALAYDTLVEHRQSDRFQEVIATTSMLATTASILATLIGGLLFVINFRLPHFVWGGTYALAFLVTLLLIEPKVDTEHFSLSNYFKQLKDGSQALFIPKLRPFVVVIFALLGAEYLYDWGLVKPVLATSFGFFSTEQAILFALFGIIGGLLVRQMPRLRRHVSDKTGLYWLSLLVGGGFIMSFFPLGFWGVIPMAIIGLSGQLAYPWVSTVVNHHIPSKLRATALSTVALISKIPYVFLAVTAGNSANNGTFNRFCLGVGLAILASIGVAQMIRTGHRRMTAASN